MPKTILKTPPATAARRFSLILSTSALAIVAVAAATGHAAEVVRPDASARPGYFDLYGISGDGRVIVGANEEDATGYNAAFKWTDAGGFTYLPQFPGADQFTESYAYAASMDGSVIAGKANDALDNYRNYAVKWTSSGIHRLTLLNNGREAFATGISSDGNIVVGGAKDGNNSNLMTPVRWTGDTIESLGVMQNSTFQYATSVNGDGDGDGDGSIVSGVFDAGNNNFGGFVWQQGVGLVDIGHLNGGSSTMAFAVSRDGSTIVGGASDLVNNNDLFVPFTYNVQSHTLTGLTMLQGMIAGEAYGVDADGGVVVGVAEMPNNDESGFRWTHQGGMQTVDDWMRANGVTLAHDITLTAFGVSDDGSIVVGTDKDYQPYIARIARPADPTPPPVPDPPPGIIVVSKYMSTIVRKAATAVAVKGMDVVMHGAHGSPMQVMPEAGKSTAWLTGDVGYHDGNGASGALGAAEVGAAHGFDGGIVGRIALGTNFDRADLDLGGSAQQDGIYILPEATFDLGGIKTTLSGYVNKSRLKVNRGYENGSVMDYSKGESDAITYAGRLRFDWLNAFSLDGTNVTPYASYTVARSQLDAYTETGGSFPASFGKQTENFNVVRLGLDLTHPLNDDVTLLGRVEGSYRFEKHGPTVSGGIVGLGDFSLPGNDYQQVWGRVGAGVEFKAGAGTGTLMVNATTEGSDPKIWLASSWRVAF